MDALVEKVLESIDKQALDGLVKELRALDVELDMKLEDVRYAEKQVSLLDRINVFTNSDSELTLKAENEQYEEIRQAHSRVIAQVKGLIREAIFRDPGLEMKIQVEEIRKAFSELRLEHRWGMTQKMKHYHIAGLPVLQKRIAQMEQMVDAHFGFDPQPVKADVLLHMVYDEILLREGFIE